MIDKKVLIPEIELLNRVRNIAVQISLDYAGKEIIFVPVLMGGMMFATDLIKMVTVQCQVECISIKSYEGKKPLGKPTLELGISSNIKDKHVIIVEDIVDTGYTLSFACDYINSLAPASLKTCVLLDKKASRKKEVPVDYSGFVIPEKFVVGYGLDLDGKYRNLSYIGTVG